MENKTEMRMQFAKYAMEATHLEEWLPCRILPKLTQIAAVILILDNLI